MVLDLSSRHRNGSFVTPKNNGTIHCPLRTWIQSKDLVLNCVQSKYVKNVSLKTVLTLFLHARFPDITLFHRRVLSELRSTYGRRSNWPSKSGLLSIAETTASGLRYQTSYDFRIHDGSLTLTSSGILVMRHSQGTSPRADLSIVECRSL